MLNGAMGGANIPDGDRQGVWDHLAAHLKDAKVTPAELKSAAVAPEIERRFLEFEVRAAGEGEPPVISGMAAVYNRETVIGDFLPGSDPAGRLPASAEREPGRGRRSQP